jgi:RNA polymerase sigma-70 factor (ECF subfamily)
VQALSTATSDEPSASIVSSRPTFPEIFAGHARYVWRVLAHLGVAAGDVEDACQEVFVVVHRRLDEWEGRGEIRSWLYGISLRVASAYRRRAHRQHEQLVDRVPEHAATDDPQGTIELRRRVDAIERALSALDEDRRAVFVLHEIEELPMREVAVILECPVHTAYGRFYAARRQIASALGVDAPEETS